MKRNKLLSIGIATITGFSLMACSQGAKTSESTTVQQQASETKAESSAMKEGGVLKVAAVETAYGSDMWKDVCAAFESQNPGLKVELTIDKNLEDVITPAMKAGDFPDVILRAVGSQSALTETFIKDNNMTELSDVLDMNVPGENIKVRDKILPGFVENSIANPYGDGKTYLMPMFYSPCGLFYDANLLKTKGWEVPQTWDQMWELAQKAKEEDIALFTYPTAGYFDAFLYALLHQSMSQEQFNEALHYGEGIWDSKEALEAFDIIEKLASYTASVTPANANDQDFKKNQQLILDDKALFMPNGSWIVGEMKDAPRADGFEWGFTALPALKEGGERASYTFFEQIWMPKEAKNVEKGKEFIAFMYSDVAADLFAKTREGSAQAIQPIKGMSAKLDGDMKLYYSIYDTGAVAVMDAFATTDPVEGITVRTTFFDPINSLVTGDKTKADWIEQIKKDSEALRGALK